MAMDKEREALVRRLRVSARDDADMVLVSRSTLDEAIAALTAQRTAPTSAELNQVLSDYCDNFQCDGADGEDEPVTDEQRKFARGVIS